MKVVTALAILLRQFGIDTAPNDIAQKWARAEPPTPRDCVHLLAGFGMSGAVRRLNFAQARAHAQAVADGRAQPALVFLRESEEVRILAGLRQDRGKPEIVLSDPTLSTPEERFSFHDAETFPLVTEGWMLFVKALGDDREPAVFGLGWFAHHIRRQSWAFRDVALAVAVLHVLGLATPLFFQLVIDRVVIHQVQSTLLTLGIGAIIALCFEAALQFLKGYILVHATAKIDIKTATHVFSRLLSLPMAFFEKAPAGVLVQHMQQDRRVREFLTGRVLLTALEATAIFVYLPLLLFYSPTLTAIVLGSAVLLTVMLIALLQPFQKRLRRQYQAEARRQALLVESTHGIGTVKSLSLEAARQAAWNDAAGDVVLTQRSVGVFVTGARSVSGLIEKLSTIAVIWVGVHLLFDGQMTVGELVAFQMLAGRVSGPLVALAGLVHEAQEAKLSLDMLSGVMNVPPEAGFGRGLRTPVRGEVSFERVTFRYPGVEEPAVNEVSFRAPAGSLIGVVGRSGSGKTTLVRLLQGTISPSAGLFKIDGSDLRELEKAQFRRQISVVPQESFLFAGTVRDNIALGLQGASIERVTEAARRAGAEDFVQRLPQGYETNLEEGAVNLSGGQKQRLALARALIRDPRILILDEATSALDPESELIIQRNLKELTRGRTTFILSHRLSMLVHATAILVMDRGRLVDAAPHDTLLRRCAIYADLWNAQAGPYAVKA
jgi:ATP-binding cassette subfamily B protein